MELIDADMKGFIRIWNFHSAKLIKTIKMETIVNGICLWDNRFLATSGRDTNIKIVDLRYQFREGNVGLSNINTIIETNIIKIETIIIPINILFFFIISPLYKYSTAVNYSQADI